MAKAIKLTSPGGPEALLLQETDPGRPGEGEVLIRQTAAGLNFIDVYHRTGLYKLPTPTGIGLEGVGVVEEAGKGTTLKVGQRVAYCGGPPGAYATHRVMSEKHLIALPDDISDQTAAAAMLKGLTAHYLLTRSFTVKSGHTVLIHAAAGGVGLILCQWAKYLGATIIGTVGNEEKATLARNHGCDKVIIYTKEDFVSRVQKLTERTEGRGVDVVYDSVGKATFMGSLDCLRKFGMMVSYGNASGPVPPIEPLLLGQKGSLYLTRPNLMHHIEDHGAYEQGSQELFDLVRKGVIKVRIGARYTLEQAAQAHRDLEARKTTAASIFLMDEYDFKTVASIRGGG